MPHPGIVEAQNRVEVRLHPFRISALFASEQRKLTENRLGLVSRSRVLAGDSEGIRAIRCHHNWELPTRRSVLDKVQETPRDMLAELLLERLIVLQLGKAEKSCARPKRVPVPEVRGEGFSRHGRRQAA